MKVTLDTNILISATFWKGSEAKIIQLAENGKIAIISSKPILEEFEKVLKRKFSHLAKEAEIKEIIEKFASLAEIVDPEFKVNLVKEDPDDNKIIECAIASNSSYIVSGDSHLLKIKQIKYIKIVDAWEFLEKIKYR